MVGFVQQKELQPALHIHFSIPGMNSGAAERRAIQHKDFIYDDLALPAYLIYQLLGFFLRGLKEGWIIVCNIASEFRFIFR